MVNWSKHDNSEDDHEDQGEDCEAGIDLEHVEEEDGELEQVADEVRNLPGYDFHNYHWVHGTLHKYVVTQIYIKNSYKVLECLRLFWSQRRPFLGIECGGKERLASLKGFNVELNVVAQPDQPPLFHDGVHEDVAGVEEGGAELCQEKAGEGFSFFKETRNPSPEDEDSSGAGVVNAAEKGRVTEKRRKSQVLKA